MIRRFSYAVLGVFAAAALSACSPDTPVSPGLDAPQFAVTGGKISICHLSKESGTYKAIDIDGHAEAAHRAHGDGQVGDEVPGMEGYVFDEACVPVSIVVNACITDATGFPINVQFNLMTGTFTGLDACPWFGGNCAVSGTVTPTQPVDLNAITDFVYVETNTASDQNSGGCPAGGAPYDAYVSTVSRTSGDLFEGTFDTICDGSKVGGPFPWSYTLTEGTCLDCD